MVTLAVAAVSWLGAFFTKRGEVKRASWEIPGKVRTADLNMRHGFNQAMGEDAEKPITLLRILSAVEDDQVLDSLRRGWVGIYETVNDIKERHDKYRLWGRILRFGLAPKALEAPEENQDGIDLSALEERVKHLESLNLQLQIEKVDSKVESISGEIITAVTGGRIDRDKLSAFEGQLQEINLAVSALAKDKGGIITLERDLKRLDQRVVGLSGDILTARRGIALHHMLTRVNTVRHWLRAKKTDKATACVGFVDRRYISGKARAEKSDTPWVEAQEFHEGVKERLDREGFEVFIEE